MGDGTYSNTIKSSRLLFILTLSVLISGYGTPSPTHAQSAEFCPGGVAAAMNSRRSVSIHISNSNNVFRVRPKFTVRDCPMTQFISVISPSNSQQNFQAGVPLEEGIDLGDAVGEKVYYLKTAWSFNPRGGLPGNMTYTPKYAGENVYYISGGRAVYSIIPLLFKATGKKPPQKPSTPKIDPHELRITNHGLGDGKSLSGIANVDFALSGTSDLIPSGFRLIGKPGYEIGSILLGEGDPLSRSISFDTTVLPEGRSVIYIQAKGVRGNGNDALVRSRVIEIFVSNGNNNGNDSDSKDTDDNVEKPDKPSSGDGGGSNNLSAVMNLLMNLLTQLIQIMSSLDLNSASNQRSLNGIDAGDHVFYFRELIKANRAEFKKNKALKPVVRLSKRFAKHYKKASKATSERKRRRSLKKAQRAVNKMMNKLEAR